MQLIEGLRAIVTEVAVAGDLAAALACVVKGVRRVMRVDACTAYLVDPMDGTLVLSETDGLARTAIGRVRLAPGEGVVGLVRERRQPVVLGDATAHPRFRHIPAIGELRYHSFLGVPMMHRGQVIGVLVVCRRSRRRFGTRQEAFLVSASAQLAAALATAHTLSASVPRAARGDTRGYWRGVAGAPGFSIGEVVALSPMASLDAVPDRPVADIAVEEAAFRDAVAAVQAELAASAERMKSLLPSEANALFEVYSMLAGDEVLGSGVIARIRAGQWAPAALRDTIAEIAAAFEAMTDEHQRARAEDIRAVGRRLLLELQVDVRAPQEFPSRTVLAGDEVSLARIADVPRERLAGVLCSKGSVLSHTAVVARALGVPAVMGVEDLPIDSLVGRTVVLDGYAGGVHVDPSPGLLEEFSRLEDEERALASELDTLRTLPCVTPDGVTLPLYVNTGFVTDIEASLGVAPAGVGLYRSEFPFMLRDSFPAEEEQLAIYRGMLEAFAPRPVIMRTLDVGGDKPLPYFPVDERNALLGWRGIRMTLQHPEIFRVQLRAMLRADIGLGNLRVLLPMVSVPAEVRETRALLQQVVEELNSEGIAATRPPLGVMLEVPLALYALDALAELSDFFSIGTNDLTQYLTAVDRGNPRVAKLYDHLNPAVLRAVFETVERARALGRSIGLCGELASDPVGAALLLGMGLDYLSIAATALPRVKGVLRSLDSSDARDLLHNALRLPDAAAVRAAAHEVLQAAGVLGLVRAGR